MQLTRFQALLLLALSILCVACPGSNTPKEQPRFSGTRSTFTRNGLKSISVNGPACVVEIQGNKVIRKTTVSPLKGDVLRSGDGPRVPFEGDSEIQVLVLPYSCDLYETTNDAPSLCMKCFLLPPAEAATYDPTFIPCCPAVVK